MGEGRGSALVVVVAILCLLAITQPTFAAIHNVGNRGGWTFNVNSWTRGKSFRAGDILAFNYARNAHNVVAVNRRGYATCSAPRGAKVYQSGRDRIRLNKGQSFFICTLPGHCQSGMKIAINAA
ncbi:Basic blue protein [Bienertia sinuspersici]